MNFDILNLNLMKSPKEFFDAFGGLHDAQVLSLNFNFEDDSLKVLIDDLYANFLNLPEYKDIKNVYLIISGCKILDINIELLGDELKIYDIYIEQSQMKIEFSPAGFLKLEFKEMYLTK